MTEPSFLDAMRTSYDRVAADYAEHARARLAEIPLERALFAAFAELVRAAGASPVADVGCGPGQLTAHLNSLGLNAFGIDLSPGMLAQARQAYPGLRFEEGSMLALDLPDGGLSGLAALFSIIHIPTEQLPALFTEFHRVLAPGGQLLVGFQIGDEQGHRTESFGQPVSIDYYLRSPDSVADLLAQAGLPVHARLTREPHPPRESASRAFLMAQKPTPPS